MQKISSFIAKILFPYKKPGMILLKEKVSTKNLRRLCEENATKDKVLVVHSEDIPAYETYFPNAYTVTKREYIKADMHMDVYYRDLSKIEDESYKFILCTGLLEHVPDPQRLINDLHRILKPGGKLVISASAVFSIHEGPHDFFHFTPFSFQLLFDKWSHIDIKGSSQPFETVAILLQRILLQCEVKSRLVLMAVELLCLFLPKLDSFVATQYSINGKREDTKIDSMMPSNIQAIAIK
ncbi:MAG: methyltransferase domain-containing protein [Scytonema sp. PMC 1070.18]|nr:methyltransferase domain-containing protein [Scytonema sp. PMC 1070.18]